MSNASNPSPAWTPRSAYVVALLTLIYALNFLDRQVLALVLPSISRELHLSDSVIGLIVGFVFVVFYSIAGIPIARLADRSNRRNILAVGLAFWSAMTILTGGVTRVWQLVTTRFLMGMGEATCIAPSTSLIADLFKPEQRALPMAIFTSGSSIAALLFFPLAGWISQQYGWRAAFVVAGAPGLILAVLLWLTVKEPLRKPDARAAQYQSAWSAFRFLLRSRAYVFIVLGGAFVAISLYASLTWNPTFLTRVHHFSQSQVGSSIGVLRGLMGLLGALLGGYVSVRLGRIDQRWRLWTPGIACILVLPAELLFLLSPGPAASLVGLGLASLLTSMHIGPIYAVCQDIAHRTMRATATAGFLFFVNLIGQVLGPFVVGALNDHWAATFGAGAIRYSLIFGAICACIGGALFVWGASQLESSTENATLFRETR